MKKILVVGDVIIDRYLYCKPKGLSPEAPILSWEVNKVESKPGGVANVVNNLYRLAKSRKSNVEIVFISYAPEELKDCIDKDFPVQRLIWSRKPTIKNRIVYEEPYQQIVRFDQDNKEPLTKEEEQLLISNIMAGTYEISLVSDYSHGSITRKVLESIREKSEIVIVDPKGNDPYKYAGLVDAIIPNLTEIMDLTSSGNYLERIHELSNLVMNNNTKKFVKVILKMGAKGCYLYQDNLETCHFQPYRTDRSVIDPTGAGDTFIAMLTLALTEGYNWEKATLMANQLAGISVTYPNCWVPMV